MNFVLFVPKKVVFCQNLITKSRFHDLLRSTFDLNEISNQLLEWLRTNSLDVFTNLLHQFFPRIFPVWTAVEKENIILPRHFFSVYHFKNKSYQIFVKVHVFWEGHKIVTISQNVAFSEYMNFKTISSWFGIRDWWNHPMNSLKDWKSVGQIQTRL